MPVSSFEQKTDWLFRIYTDFFKNESLWRLRQNLHLNEVMGRANIAVANDLTWTTERTGPLNLEKRKISFILFHEICNIFLATDCKHYTFIRTTFLVFMHAST